MNDLYSVITGLLMHAYSMAGFIVIISIPARMLFKALHGRNPL